MKAGSEKAKVKGMSGVKERRAPERCERCDRETEHIIELTNPDNTTSRVCWSCFSRGEKRINVRENWKRERRAR